MPSASDENAKLTDKRKELAASLEALEVSLTFAGRLAAFDRSGWITLMPFDQAEHDGLVDEQASEVDKQASEIEAAEQALVEAQGSIATLKEDVSRTSCQAMEMNQSCQKLNQRTSKIESNVMLAPVLPGPLPPGDPACAHLSSTVANTIPCAAYN